jgi:hypothetical protein
MSVAKKIRREAHDWRAINHQLADLMEWLVSQSDGWHTESALWRVLHSPGRAGLAGHRIMAEVPPRRLKDIHDAFVLQMPTMQRALFLEYAALRDDRGRLLSRERKAEIIGISLQSWDRLIARSREQVFHTFTRPPGQMTPRGLAKLT